MAADFGLQRDDITNFPQKEPVDCRLAGNGVLITAQAEQLRDSIDPVVGPDADVVEQVLFRYSVKFRQMDVKSANLQRADAFQQAFLKGPANAHHFPGSFHLGGKGVICV